jgi:hypothetical protein
MILTFKTFIFVFCAMLAAGIFIAFPFYYLEYLRKEAREVEKVYLYAGSEHVICLHTKAIELYRFRRDNWWILHLRYENLIGKYVEGDFYLFEIDQPPEKKSKQEINSEIKIKEKPEPIPVDAVVINPEQKAINEARGYHLKPKRCQNEACKNIFIPSAAAQKFCSTDCGLKERWSPTPGEKLRVTQKTKICANPECRKEFKPIGNAQRYCSEECGMRPKVEKKQPSREEARETKLFEVEVKPKEEIPRSIETVITRDTGFESKRIENKRMSIEKPGKIVFENTKPLSARSTEKNHDLEPEKELPKEPSLEGKMPFRIPELNNAIFYVPSDFTPDQLAEYKEKKIAAHNRENEKLKGGLGHLRH